MFEVDYTVHNYNYTARTEGGLKGHIVRRLIHLFSLLVPILYYFYGDSMSKSVGLTAPVLAILILVIILMFEVLRIRLGWTMFGQRNHEKKRFSSFAWSAVGIVIVLLLAPNQKYGFPIIWSWVLADPLMGELRPLKINKFIVFISGIVLVCAIWFLCAKWLGTPLWLAWIMGPITIASEWPNIKKIDDNVTMQVIPLIVILGLAWVGLL